VVVDANVLYSIELTDLLLTFASHRLVRVHWSPIRPRACKRQARRLRSIQAVFS